MGALLKNKLDGTDGVTVSTANSAAGGDAFTTVNSSATIIYEADVSGAVQSGTTAVYISGDGTQGSLVWSGTFSNRIGLRGYYYWPTSLPGVECRIMAARHAGGLIGGVSVRPSGRLAWLNSSGVGTDSWTSDDDIEPDTLYRIEAVLEAGTTTGNGIIDVAVYEGDSLTPIKSVNSTTANLSTATVITDAQFGKVTSSGAQTVLLDSVAAWDDPTGYIGIETPDSAVEYTTTTFLEVDCSGSVGDLTLTQLSGTTVTAITGPASGVFTIEMPAEVPDVLTFELEADAGGTPATETITIRPKNRRFVLTRQDDEWIL